MINRLRSLFLILVCLSVMTVFASAEEGILKVGLNYGDNALSAANLQNEVGSGYLVGWYDEVTRDFANIGFLTDTKITMTVSNKCHVQIEETFSTFEEASFVANQFNTGFVCYFNNA